jgi:hypothetical protein
MRTPTRISNVLIKRGGRLTRPLLVAALAAGLVVAGSSAAQAQSITDVDTAGDMVRLDDETEEPSPAPNQVRNDVLRTTLTHSATRISIRVKYAELQRVGHGHGLWLEMATNEGVRRNLDVLAGSGEWSGSTEMTRGWDGGEVRCALRHSIDYTRNVIAVSFPRQCASSPRWVKFRVLGFRAGETGFYLDDAIRDEPFLISERSVQSRRVYRAS